VLIPAYNEEAVIAISVQAALAADYPDLEVLDDGSADETAAVATEKGNFLELRLYGVLRR
jgi:peptidoglycan-N-acetylglucosamine deacetylase